MLAQQIRTERRLFRPLREFGRHARDVECADLPVLDPPHGPAFAQMRVPHRFVQCEDRRAGNTLGFESFHGGLTRREPAEPFLDDFFQRLVVVAPRARRAETRIVRQGRHAHRFDHLRPLVRHHHDRDEIFALAAKYPRGTASGCSEPMRRGANDAPRSDDFGTLTSCMWKYVSSSEHSMYWPSPVRSRCSRAKPTAIAAVTPVELSPIAVAIWAGPRSASPIVEVMPE